MRKELRGRYEHIDFNDSGTSLSGKKLAEFLRGHEKAIVALEVLDDKLFDAVPTLRHVSKYGVGLDTMDLVAMARRGIVLGWTGGVNRRSVAELVLAFAIALLHRVPEGQWHLRQASWAQPVGRELRGRTVGIIGCGHVGKEVAILMRALECRVLAHDIQEFQDFYETYSVEPAGLEALLRRSDVVSLHVPLDESTRNMLSAARLGLLPRNAVLINAARGGLVDEEALKRLLRSGHLGGAAFDVFQTEPPDDPELLALPSFMATPHIGGSSQEAILAMGRAAIQGLTGGQVPGNGWPGPACL